MRTLQEVKQAVIDAVERRGEELIAMGDRIWRNPEPGYKEFKTSKLATEKLKSLGLDVVDEPDRIVGLGQRLDDG